MVASWKKILEDKNAIVLPTIKERDLQEAIGKFLISEPDWLDNAIARDPALRKNPDGTDISKEEAYTKLFTYQGLHAIALHRQAAELEANGQHVEAQALSRAARDLTGIEIHPGARIGKNFFIDHGTGTIIGATAEIGDNVFLYHNITLGATGTPENVDNSDPHHPARRHPKIGNNVTIGNGANIIGPVTVEDYVSIGFNARILGNSNLHIGTGAIIGDGVEVKQSVPEGAKVVGMVPYIPGVIGDKNGARTPIIKEAKPGTKVQDTEWLGHLARGYKRLAEHASALTH